MRVDPAWVAPDLSTWTSDGEALRTSSDDTSVNHFIERTDLGARTDVEAQLGARILGLPPTINNRFFGPVVRTAGNNGYICDAHSVDAAGDNIETRLLTGGSGGTQLGIATPVDEMPLATPLVVRCSVRGFNLTTTLAINGGTSFTTSGSDVNSFFISGAAGMRVRELDMQLDWFAVYGLAP